MAPIAVYLEIAAKRVFAGAIDWPGWDRSGRDEERALEAFLAAGKRYRAALGRAAARGLELPEEIGDVEVVERHEGDGGTEFGVPSSGPRADQEPLDEAGLRRLVAILRRAWATFDEAAATAERSRAQLRKGPRGGGRDLDMIREHVFGAEEAYLRQIGGSVDKARRGDVDAVRSAAVEALGARARGEPFEMGRRTAPLWTPRYHVRRSAWHALDHAWEIEDRSER